MEENLAYPQPLRGRGCGRSACAAEAAERGPSDVILRALREEDQRD